MRILYSMGTRLYTSRVCIETERKKLNYTNSNACIDIPPSFEALMSRGVGVRGGLNNDHRRDNRERVLSRFLQRWRRQQRIIRR